MIMDVIFMISSAKKTTMYLLLIPPCPHLWVLVSLVQAVWLAMWRNSLQECLLQTKLSRVGG